MHTSATLGKSSWDNGRLHFLSQQGEKTGTIQDMTSRAPISRPILENVLRRAGRKCIKIGSIVNVRPLYIVF